MSLENEWRERLRVSEERARQLGGQIEEMEDALMNQRKQSEKTLNERQQVDCSYSSLTLTESHSWATVTAGSEGHHRRRES